MRREQAIAIIKQIFEQCNQIEGKSIKLMPPQNNNALSETFQIYIQTNNDCVLIDCIKATAKEHYVEVRIKDHMAIIYKPYPDLKV